MRYDIYKKYNMKRFHDPIAQIGEVCDKIRAILVASGALFSQKTVHFGSEMDCFLVEKENRRRKIRSSIVENVFMSSYNI